MSRQQLGNSAHLAGRRPWCRVEVLLHAARTLLHVYTAGQHVWGRPPAACPPSHAPPLLWVARRGTHVLLVLLVSRRAICTAPAGRSWHLHVSLAQPKPCTQETAAGAVSRCAHAG